MGKLYYEMIKQAGRRVTGQKLNKVESEYAMALVRTGVILFAFDYVMTGLMNFDRDRFGLSYSKEVDTPEGKGEVVISAPNPANMMLKYLYRLRKLMLPGTVDTPLALFNSFKWELHPVWKTGINLFVTNRDDKGERIVNEFDDFTTKQAKRVSYAGRTIVALFGAMDPVEYDAISKEKLKEEAGEIFTTITGPFTYSYLRLHPKTRAALQMKRLQKRRESEIYEMTRIAQRTGGQLDRDRIETMTKNFTDRLTRIQEQFEKSEKVTHGMSPAWIP